MLELSGITRNEDLSSLIYSGWHSFVDQEDFLVIHARGWFNSCKEGTTPYTHSNPGTPINMPWFGSTQTGREHLWYVKLKCLCV